VIQILADKGAQLAISDAGCGAICCKAALQAASLNVFINTGCLQNREKAAELEAQANAMLDKYCPMAEAMFQMVREKL
jgi:formiminotetrahydrofolate cyclodeaminase